MRPRIGIDGLPIPLLCRLNLHHHWHAFSTDDGRRYLRCHRCGKDDARFGAPPGWMEGFGAMPVPRRHE